MNYGKLFIHLKIHLHKKISVKQIKKLKKVLLFVFLGTGLEFEFKEKNIIDDYLWLKITFKTNILNELNKDLIILKINEKKIRLK